MPNSSRLAFNKDVFFNSCDMLQKSAVEFGSIAPSPQRGSLIAIDEGMIDE